MPLKQVQAQNLKVGDLVQVEDWPAPAHVQGIHIVLHMDNNMDLVVTPTDKLYVVPDE